MERRQNKNKSVKQQGEDSTTEMHGDGEAGNRNAGNYMFKKYHSVN